jgi:hypothetical protein
MSLLFLLNPKYYQPTPSGGFAGGSGGGGFGWTSKKRGKKLRKYLEDTYNGKPTITAPTDLLPKIELKAPGSLDIKYIPRLSSVNSADEEKVILLWLVDDEFDD